MFLISKIQENCFFLYSQKQVFENKKQKLLPNITVGPEGSRGFGPFHLKPKAYAEEEEVPGDE